ncbi:MAG TPA: hypothetical protein VG245_01980 [Candidatus Dormibacteraeota bacterium]|jgi:hypothetical protein|nr:hypothetical protein [Candidatus Dormibacteraeota bacterium]
MTRRLGFAALAAAALLSACSTSPADSGAAVTHPTIAPSPFFIGSPPVLASGQAQRNQWGQDAMVYITARDAAVSVTIGPAGNAHDIVTIPPRTAVSVRVLADQYIILNYAGPAPTWVWNGG